MRRNVGTGSSRNCTVATLIGSGKTALVIKVVAFLVGELCGLKAAAAAKGDVGDEIVVGVGVAIGASAAVAFVGDTAIVAGVVVAAALVGVVGTEVAEYER